MVWGAKGARLELFFKRSKQLARAPERRKEKAENLAVMIALHSHSTNRANDARQVAGYPP